MPFATPIACSTPRYAAASSSKALDVRAEDEPPGVEDFGDSLLQLVQQRRVLRLDVNERDLRHGGASLVVRRRRTIPDDRGHDEQRRRRCSPT